LSRHVDEIRAAQQPLLSQPAPCGQSESQLGITRNWYSRKPHLAATHALGYAQTRRFLPLPGADDRNAVTTPGEPVHEVAERHGDAIYFRRIGFGDEDKIQGCWPLRRSDNQPLSALY